MFYFVKRGEYLRFATPYGYGMFEVCGGLAVAGAYAPSVGHQPYLSVAHSNHWLYGYAHAFLEKHSVSFSTVIGYRGFFMHLPSDSVSSEFTYDSIAMTFTKSLYSVTNVSDMITCHCHFYTFVQRLSRHCQQIPDILADISDTKGVGRVSVISSKKCATIDGNNISILENSLFVGYSVHYDIIDRCADTSGKRPSKWIGKILERWNGSIVTDKFLRHPIQLKGRYSWFDMLGQFSKSSTDKSVSLAHQLDFVFSLQKYLHFFG